jgi:outer membrane lipoprotein-sorting protein
MRPNFMRGQDGKVRKLAALSGIVSAMAAAVVLMGVASRPNDVQPPSNVSGRTLSTTSSTAPPPALEAFARAWDGVTAYHAKVTVFAQKDSKIQNLVLDYTFRKPSSFTVHVVDGPNAGITLTWDGGTTVQASRGGGLFAALLKRTIPLHDPLVTTIRGASMDQLSYGAILAHAKQTPGRLAESPGEPISGTPTQELSLLPSDPAADAGLSREVIDVSTATLLPIRIEGYEGSKIVRKIDFSEVQPEK